jgi:hypothetical protein
MIPNETNVSRRVLDGLGSDRDGYQTSGENTVGPHCKGRTSIRGNMAVKAPPVVALVGKAKAPIIGKGKDKGKGPIVTRG